MLRWLRPNEFADSLFKINFERLYKMGFRAIILDIDDTLIPKHVNEIYPAVLDFIEDLKATGFKICLTSNNRHPLRVQYIGKNLGLPFSSLSLKPLPFAFDKALAMMDAKPEETLVIGDQLFTDILGGNIKKLYTVFVEPMTEETFFLRQWMRVIEEWIIARWQREEDN
ncbi:MAG: YqeG family HAD IIIA-type phosphatase [Candidatus Saganbacteria bacterium]|nr:YqeG family HAD IIIA-type phosphatase [Candidatus Saganbacteria bacterium]